MSHTGAALPRSVTNDRAWNLALAFQEALTATLRLRFNRDAVPNADVFRAQMKSILRAASQDAEAHGYSAEDIRSAMFAIVAFLDESVLTSRNPTFADWPRLPLQEELFGGHVAGEIFFQNLRAVLARAESPATFDLLHVYYLCLLLGYRGRYGASGAGELRAIMTSLREKIERGREPTSLAACAGIPAEAVRELKTDPWVQRFKIAAIASLLLAAVLFVTFKLVLI